MTINALVRQQIFLPKTQFNHTLTELNLHQEPQINLDASMSNLRGNNKPYLHLLYAGLASLLIFKKYYTPA